VPPSAAFNDKRLKAFILSHQIDMYIQRTPDVKYVFDERLKAFILSHWSLSQWILVV